MKDQQKRIVTFAMIWIAAVGFAATPAWWRAFRDFIAQKTTGAPATPPMSDAARKKLESLHGPGGARDPFRGE